MYESIDIVELSRMANLAEESCAFDMRYWDCGTTACLVGTWMRATTGDQLHYIVGTGPCMGNLTCEEACAARFNLPLMVTEFLFVSHRGRGRSANTLSNLDAIVRLRMFIRYVERKRALWEEHAWMMSLSRRDRRERLMGKMSRSTGVLVS